MRAFPLFTCAFLGFCIPIAEAQQRLPASTVEATYPQLNKLIEKHSAGQQKKAFAELKKWSQLQAHFKTRLALTAMQDPWKGSVLLEQRSLQLALTAKKGRQHLPALIGQINKMADWPTHRKVDVPGGKLTSLEELTTDLIRVLDQMNELQEEGLNKIPDNLRDFQFRWTGQLLTTFGPQLPFNEKTKPILHNDRTFCGLITQETKRDKLTLALQLSLRHLLNEQYLKTIQRTLKVVKPIKEDVAGVKGRVLFQKKTPHGLVLIGGSEANEYQFKEHVALLIDLGGNDTYHGPLACSGNAKQRNGIVIDLAGNDTWNGTESGLATGRGGGVGLLFDYAGNDTYHLPQGTGGCGLGGFGVLLDVRGADTYVGSKYTQGVGFAGYGLLLDFGGDDRHTSSGFAMGFGGPAGVGLVLDAEGNDQYQCGKKYPSGYNQSDAPKAKPGDADFQYTSMGMGMGLGRRLFPLSKESLPYGLAGGIGMVIDLQGNDRTETSNFSQGCGYFYGVGVKMDLEGEDHHAAARYGHASAAHFGIGSFFDYAGKDTYTSTGPTYNCGCAWDRSVCTFVEGGKEDDQYLFKRSAGPARADIGSWSLFLEMGGDDQYLTRSVGKISRDGFTIFFDASGKDKYELSDKLKVPPENGKTFAPEAGGLFVDE